MSKAFFSMMLIGFGFALGYVSGEINAITDIKNNPAILQKAN